MYRTLGEPGFARRGAGHAGVETSAVRPTTPGNAEPGSYSLRDMCRPFGGSEAANDAAKAKVTSRGVDGLRHARSRTVAMAVARRAEVRPALHDTPGDAKVRAAGIHALLARAATRIVERTAMAHDLRVV